SSPKYIETIAKRGYRFLGRPEVIPESTPEVVRPATPQPLRPEPQIQPVADPAAAVPSSAHTASDSLPRTNRGTARLLFILTQVMYLIFYLSALFRWENTYRASYIAWGRAGATAFTLYMATALVGLAVRLYLISATAMDYHLLGAKFRILTPA